MGFFFYTVFENKIIVSLIYSGIDREGKMIWVGNTLTLNIPIKKLIIRIMTVLGI